MNLGNGIFVSLVLSTNNKIYFIDYINDKEKGNHLNIICCDKDKETNKQEFSYKIEKDYLLFDEYLADCLRVVKQHDEYLEKIKIVKEREEQFKSKQENNKEQ